MGQMITPVRKADGARGDRSPPMAIALGMGPDPIGKEKEWRVRDERHRR